MALDPSIALAYRAPQFDNPLARYGQIAQIQGAQNSNRLADLQYRQAQQAEADNNALRRMTQGADPSTPEGVRQLQNAYLSVGNIRGAQELGDNALKAAKTRGEIAAQGLKAANDRFNAVSAAMAPFVNKPDLTHDDVFATLGRLESMGMVDRSLRSLIPMDATKLPGFVKQLAIESEQGRKALESILPKVSMTDIGGQIVPTNTNTLAGPVGPLAGAAPLTKTQTPDSVASVAQQEANRAQQWRIANMTDARARETLQAGRVPSGYRAKPDGSLEPIPGGPADGKADKLGEAAKKQIAGIDALESAINSYTDALKNWSRTDAMNPSKVAVMGTLYNNMMLQGKEAFGLGVLNGPDYDILQSVVRDPTKGMSLVFSPEDLSNQAKTLKKLMVDTRAQIKNQGRGDGAVPPANPETPAAEAPKPMVFKTLPDATKSNGKWMENGGVWYKSDGKTWVRQ